MDLKSAFARASRGMREEAGLHLVAISSLTIAFLCLGTSLLVISNLGALAEAWGRSARVTVFLRDGAETQTVEALRMTLEALPEVERIEHVSASDARTQFLRDSGLGTELESLPTEAFPASLEIAIRAGTPSVRIDSMAERVERFGVVEEVETYRGWFARLEALVDTGRGVAMALGLLVVFCVMFVVGNTIRLAVAGRRDEIEVMKLCGASDGFVRGPFIVEGAAQGTIASVAALLVLFIAFLLLRGHLDGTLAAMAGMRTVFLNPVMTLSLVVGGMVLGAVGSALSLRRYLSV
jgi:cell division transport system permease protein